MPKNLLNVSDLNKDDFHQILQYSEDLSLKLDGALNNKHIGLIFEKQSTRTRISFQVAINQLKGKYVDIKLDELNLNRFESYEETFEVMSCYLDCLIYRTTDHNKLELARKYFKKPIINALSDLSHPCQAISDIFTLKEHFNDCNNLNIVWMGDINNVLLSLIEAVKFLENTKVDIFTNKIIFDKNFTKLESDSINVHFEINDEILKSAHCVMTDVYNSMNDIEDKEPQLIKFQVNEDLMAKTNSQSIFMHCLPAKIGVEVTENVIKGSNSIVLKQAKNRMVVQRGILKWLEI